jgi:hypothetical protein
LISIPNDVMIFVAIEFPFQFSDLGAVSVHLLIGAGLVLVDLVDHQGRISKHYEAFYTKFSSDTEAMECCLLFGGVIGGQKWIQKT